MCKATSQRTRTARSRAVADGSLFALVTGIAFAASLATSPAALASRSQSTVFDLGGTALDIPKVQRDGQLDQLKAFGVDTVRVIVAWNRIAPDPSSHVKPLFDATDPAAYPQNNWGPVDDLVKGAQSRGMNVLFTPSGPVPLWASASHEAVTDPSAGEFQLFVQALGTRYSGIYSPPPPQPTDPPNPPLPRVDFWSVWNEPNLTLFLKPQLRHHKSVSGRIYRELFLAAQRGLIATGHATDPILIGETSPGGGRKGTDPITFMRGVFCLNRKFKRSGGCAPIDADGWAQHPYDPLDAPFESSHHLINLHTIGQLAKALNKSRAARATTIRLPIYVTEYGIESVPDRKFGVSQLRQAEYIGISEYLMYGNPRIRSFGQYLMQDDPGTAQINFQTGLRFNGGATKASYAAFPIALVAQRRSEERRKVVIWGHVRPDGAPFVVTVKAKGPGAPHTLKTIHTSAGGYFQFRTPFRKRRRYSASTLLPDGTQLTGPFVRVYVFK
jgi:hypothetical protein